MVACFCPGGRCIPHVVLVCLQVVVASVATAVNCIPALRECNFSLVRCLLPISAAIAIPAHGHELLAEHWLLLHISTGVCFAKQLVLQASSQVIYCLWLCIASCMDVCFCTSSGPVLCHQVYVTVRMQTSGHCSQDFASWLDHHSCTIGVHGSTQWSKTPSMQQQKMICQMISY